MMGGLFGKTPKQPASPKIPPVTPMPDPEDPVKNLGAQQRIAQRIFQSGRQSTFLSQNKADKLGG